MAAALAEAAMAGDTSAVELDADFVQRMQLAGRIPEFIGLVERIIGQSEDATSAGADIH
jgi:hypothetical protein